MNWRKYYTAGVVSLLLLALAAPSRSRPTYHDIVRQHLARSSNSLESCYGALHLSDEDGDGILQADEYAAFISRIGGVEHAAETFADLPFVLRINFAYLSCRCRLHPRAPDHGGDACCTGPRKGIYVFGTGPGEGPASPGEAAYLRAVCADTVGTIEYEPPTAGPTTSRPPTDAPTTRPQTDAPSPIRASEPPRTDPPAASAETDVPTRRRTKKPVLFRWPTGSPVTESPTRQRTPIPPRTDRPIESPPTETPTRRRTKKPVLFRWPTASPATEGPTKPLTPAESPLTESPTRRRTRKPVLFRWPTVSPATEGPTKSLTPGPPRTNRPTESPWTEGPAKQQTSTAGPVLVRWPTESLATQTPVQMIWTTSPAKQPTLDVQFRWPTMSPVTQGPTRQPTPLPSTPVSGSPSEQPTTKNPAKPYATAEQPSSSTARGSPSPSARPTAEATQYSLSIPPSEPRSDLSVEEGARSSYLNNAAEERIVEEGGSSGAGSIHPGAIAGIAAAITICLAGAFFVTRRRNGKGRQSGDNCDSHETKDFSNVRPIGGREEEDSTLESSLKYSSSSNESPTFDEDQAPPCERAGGRNLANGVVGDLEARQEEARTLVSNLVMEEDRSSDSDSSSVATTLISNCRRSIKEEREISCFTSDDYSSVESSSAGESGWSSSAGNSLDGSFSSSCNSDMAREGAFNSSFNSDMGRESPQHTIGASKEIAEIKDENHVSGDEHQELRGEPELPPPLCLCNDSMHRSDPPLPGREMPTEETASSVAHRKSPPSSVPSVGGDTNGASDVDSPMIMNWDGMGRIASLLAENQLPRPEDGDKSSGVSFGGMMTKLGFSRKSSSRSGGRGVPATKNVYQAGTPESSTLLVTSRPPIPTSPDPSRRPSGEAIVRSNSEDIADTRERMQHFNALLARGDWSGAVTAAGQFQEIEEKNDAGPGRLAEESVPAAPSSAANRGRSADVTPVERRQSLGGRDEARRTAPTEPSVASGNSPSIGSQFKAQGIELRLLNLGASGAAARRAGRLVHIHYITLSARGIVRDLNGGGDGGMVNFDVDAVISTMAEHGLSGDEIASILSRRPSVATMRARAEGGLISKEMLEVLASARRMDS